MNRAWRYLPALIASFVLLRAPEAGVERPPGERDERSEAYWTDVAILEMAHVARTHDELLRALVEQPDNVREAALNFLHQDRSPETLDAVRRCLRDGSFFVQLAAARTLYWLGAVEEARRHLRARLAAMRELPPAFVNWSQAIYAAEELAEFGAPERLDVVLDVLRSPSVSNSEEVSAAQALPYFAEASPDVVFDALAELSLPSHSPRVRWVAIDGLLRVDGGRALPLVSKYRDDPDRFIQARVRGAMEARQRK